MGRTFFGIVLALFLLNIFALLVNVQTVEASGTIYIRPDGSIDPPTANIATVDNITYFFTGDIFDEIVVERSNIIVDGNGYTLQGLGTGCGFCLSGISNVTIQDTNIKSFFCGVLLLYGSSHNTVSGNNITKNYYGAHIDKSSNNTVSGNNITNSQNAALWLHNSSNNFIYHNNIINNTYRVYVTSGYINFWDNGYPSGGNYWSDYTDVDLYSGPDQNVEGRDGIWDHPYVIDADNTDNYPLMKPYEPGSLSVSIYTDKYTYHAGETMHLGLDIKNPDSVKYVCFAIWVKRPDGSIYLYIHEHSVVLPIGLNYADPTFKSITLPNIPPGTYTWHAAFLERATHKIIVEDTAEWEFI